jgi:hypothetical protein
MFVVQFEKTTRASTGPFSLFFKLNASLSLSESGIFYPTICHDSMCRW